MNLKDARLLLDVANAVALEESLDGQLARLITLITEATEADRGTLFVNDPETQELYSRQTVGGLNREIRLLNNRGVAGQVFQSGEGVLIADAYADPHFESSIDEQTGYRTETIACAPLRTIQGEVIGVVQVLNHQGKGGFTETHLTRMEAMARQASVSVQRSLLLEEAERKRAREQEFLAMVSELSGELKLGSLLGKVIGTITRMLNAERSTLFLNDEKTGELYTEIGEGLGATKIRFPNHLGIAGAVYTSGETINIPYAYADLRFNPSFDRQTGFFTRSILCTPLLNKSGKVIGATQVLNKRGGVFSDDDASRLKAFTAQMAVALENAKLFDDVQTMKTYAESMLESMASGVITFNENDIAQTINRAGCRIFRARSQDVVGVSATELLSGSSAWLAERLVQVRSEAEPVSLEDVELDIEGHATSANINLMPLRSLGAGEAMGSMLMIEDISEEKRMKGTMARYMDPLIADSLMREGSSALGGQESEATVLFSDIRSFTTLTESLGAQGTVSMLNAYFSLMVDCLQQEGGILDKFIGDAVMAVFGLPLPHGDDADRAVRTALAMLTSLQAFNQARAEEGLMAIRIGIGLHTDVVVSGNIGSPKRMNYTVIGDGVNLAARLESACKHYGAQLLISENTRSHLKGTYRMREADRVVVKGKTEPVVIHEVLDFHTDDSFPAAVQVLGHYRDGLELYRASRFQEGLASFEQALALHPADRLSSLNADRCRHYLEQPPGPDWDGIWVLKDK
ncbi:MAG: GAF domain-containing protein [Vulcanococcus sp.]